MEYWYKKRMTFGFKFLINIIHIKLDLVPPTQYSNIPLLQYPITVEYGT
jgi:hypothetical protein